MSCPLFVELCAGTAALSLRLHAGRNARPPVSRMGAKTGYADVILRCLGLRPGQGHTDGTRYLWCEPDAGVRLLLHAYTDRDLATAAAEIIRSWKDEDPRALWERLRAEGPARCPEGLTAREVARWVRLITSNRLIPGAWSADGRWVNAARDGGPGTRGGVSFGGSDFCTPPSTLADALSVVPTLPATIHSDAREVARWLTVTGWRIGESGNRYVGPGTPANPAVSHDGMVARLRHTLSATIHPDARAIDPPTLPPGTVAYIDPPYLNTTGYAHDLGRDEVVRLARRWADAGATVCISEAEPIPELLADGWHKVEITRERKGQRRTFSKQQAEWLTLNRAPSWVPSVQASLFGAA